MPRNPTVYTKVIAGIPEIAPGSPIVGPQVPEGYQWVLTDIEAFQGGDTSEFVSVSFGVYTPVGTTDSYFQIGYLEKTATLLYPAWAQWEGRVAVPEGTYLGFQSYYVLGAPNVYVTGYELTLP